MSVEVAQPSSSHEVTSRTITREGQWGGKIENAGYVMTLSCYFSPWLPAQKCVVETNTSFLVIFQCLLGFCYVKQTQLITIAVVITIIITIIISVLLHLQNLQVTA